MKNDRTETIERAIAALRASGGGTLIICQGEPRCALVSDEAHATQKAGCPWCERVLVSADGGVSIRKPGLA